MKKFYLFLSLAMVAGGVSARQISEQEARALAASKISLEDNAVMRVISRDSTMPTSSSSSSSAPVYMFNSPKGGFAIISGDDRMPNMVLAYSETGSLDPDNCSPAMRAWLDELSGVISSGDFSKVRRASLDYSNPVKPLVTTKWNQMYPYNMMTPLGSTDENCPTGCVATAMAQIVNYWQCPKEFGTGEHSYEWNDQILSVDFSRSSYDWNNMLDIYDENATQQQNEAVAKLMWECGVACDMQYGDEESGAFGTMAARGLRENLGYNPGLRIRYRDVIPSDEWFAMVKHELDAARPVAYYGATPRMEGHAFVCDGYDSEGLFHINWGWGGVSDGYFVLDALDPREQGTGGAASGEGFSMQQSMITDLRPAQEGDVPSNGWELQVADFTIEPVNEEATLFNMSWYVFNAGYTPFTGTIGLYLWNETTGAEPEFEVVEVFGEDEALGFNLSSNMGFEEIDGTQLADGIWNLALVAIGENSEEAVSIPTAITDAPLRFEIKDGAVIYDVRPQLAIKDLELDEIGFYCTIGSVVRGQLANLSFTVENTSEYWFKSALSVTVEYVNGVISSFSKETSTIGGIPYLGPGEAISVQVPIAYNVEGPVEITIDTATRMGETPQEVIFTDNQLRFESDGVYHELELMSLPEVNVSEDKVSFALEVGSVTAPVQPYGSPDPDFEAAIEKEVVCNIYPVDSQEAVASVTATYQGAWHEISTLEFAPEQNLEPGEYQAVFSYESVPNFMGETLQISLGQELEGFEGVYFSIGTTGVENIVDETLSTSTAIEITNLNGIRINDTRSLTPGIYIMRQGDKVSKVIVK